MMLLLLPACQRASPACHNAFDYANMMFAPTLLCRP